MFQFQSSKTNRKSSQEEHKKKTYIVQINFDYLSLLSLLSFCTLSFARYVFYQTFIKPSMQLSLMRDILKAIMALSPAMQTQIYEKLGELLKNQSSA